MATLGQAGKFAVNLSGTYTELLGQTGGTVTMSDNAIDTTNKDSDLDQEFAGGERGWEATITGIIDGTDSALDYLEDCIADGTDVDVRLDVNGVRCAGTCVVTAISFEAPKDNVYSYSVSLKGDGALTRGVATAFESSGSHYIVAPNAGITGNTDCSIDFWIYPDVVTLDYLQYWFLIGGASATSVGRSGRHKTTVADTTTIVYFGNATGGYSPEYSTTPAAWGDTWHHVLMTFNAATDIWTSYVDGVSRGTQNVATVLADSSIYLGYITGLGGYTGKILAPRLFNRVISGAEVATLMGTLSLPVGYSGLLWQYLWYDSTTIADSSGNGNDATNGSAGSNKVTDGGNYVLSGGVPVEVGA